MNASLSTIILVTVTATVLSLEVIGLTRAAVRAGFSNPVAFGLCLAAGLSAWLALTGWFAINGLLEVSEGRMPREPLLPPIALITFILLGLTGTFRRLLAVLPTWQPIALMTFRAGVEAGFWAMYHEGIAPVQVTFEGRNFDVLIGLTAPIVALSVSRGWFGGGTLLTWNGLGLIAIGNAIFTTATSAPGPQHLNWPGESFTAIAEWPIVWIPAFLAPTAIFLHIVSIRQARSLLL